MVLISVTVVVLKEYEASKKKKTFKSNQEINKENWKKNPKTDLNKNILKGVFFLFYFRRKNETTTKKKCNDSNFYFFVVGIAWDLYHTGVRDEKSYPRDVKFNLNCYKGTLIFFSFFLVVY